MQNLTPNGSTGTFNYMPYVDPVEMFDYTDMNALAENTSFLMQTFEPMLTTHYEAKVASGPKYLIYTSDIIKTFIPMNLGTYQIQCSLYKGIFTGAGYSGTLYIDGTTLKTFTGINLATPVYGSMTFVNTSSRWVEAKMYTVPNNTSQFFDFDVWIGYRSMV